MLWPEPPAYTRLVERLYFFERLYGSAFQGELPVDEEGKVLGSPGWFQRVQV